MWWWHTDMWSPWISRWSWRNHRIAKWRSNLRLCSCNTPSMRCPIEFKTFVGATRNLFSVQRVKYISRSLKIWKFYETVSNGLPCFVSDELHACYRRNLVKLLSYMVLIHPWLDISDPKRSALSLSTISSRLTLIWSWHSSASSLSLWVRVHIHAIHIFCLKNLSFKY